jgi:hypothetical protein
MSTSIIAYGTNLATPAVDPAVNKYLGKIVLTYEVIYKSRKAEMGNNGRAE